jgi:hypothetical protein
MRRTVPLFRSGLSVAAAVVLLSGCGGSGDDESASSSSSARSSAAGTSAEASGSEFCTEAATALSSVEPAFNGAENDPGALAPALQEAADKVRAIDPPTEISADWTALADGIEQLAQAFASVDVNDPASATALQQRTAQVIGTLTTSATSVQTYLAEKCGITAPTDVSAPTS